MKSNFFFFNRTSKPSSQATTPVATRDPMYANMGYHAGSDAEQPYVNIGNSQSEDVRFIYLTFSLPYMTEISVVIRQ